MSDKNELRAAIERVNKALLDVRDLVEADGDKLADLDTVLDHWDAWTYLVVPEPD